jgi:hypothetical protein
VAGLFLGSVWWNIENGDYQQRMSLYAVAYFYINVAMGEQLDGIHRRKMTFLRERLVMHVCVAANNWIVFNLHIYLPLQLVRRLQLCGIFYGRQHRSVGSESLWVSFVHPSPVLAAWTENWKT